jgi:hypothetical protein
MPTSRTSSRSASGLLARIGVIRSPQMTHTFACSASDRTEIIARLLCATGMSGEWSRVGIVFGIPRERFPKILWAFQVNLSTILVR